MSELLGAPWDLVNLPAGIVDPADRLRTTDRAANDPEPAHRDPTPEQARDLRERYARDVPAERAWLAMTDPGGERGAVAPLSPVRARQTLLGYHDVADRPTGSPAHERDVALLERLGADLSRGSGRVRCPAHGSTSKTIAWRKGDRRYLVKCFAGCTFAEIEAAA